MCSAAAGWGEKKAFCSSWEGAGGRSCSLALGADGPQLFLCALWHREGCSVVGRKGCSHGEQPQTQVFCSNLIGVTQGSIAQGSCGIAQPRVPRVALHFGSQVTPQVVMGKICHDLLCPAGKSAPAFREVLLYLGQGPGLWKVPATGSCKRKAGGQRCRKDAGE